jgi:hypothetical protein
MTFQAYCPHCEKKVTAHTLLSGKEPKAALDNNGEVEVMHTAENGDHAWRLNNQEKENLRNAIAKGLLSRASP